MRDAVQQAINDIQGRKHANGLLIIGIDGPGGSGKSTLAHAIADQMPGVEVIEMDDFYLPTADRVGLGPNDAMYDLRRLQSEVLDPVRLQRPARYQRYDWDVDALDSWTPVQATFAVIVEGVRALDRSIRSRYDYRIFCLAARSVRLDRGIERDGEESRSQWEDEWMPAEDRYFASQQPQNDADLIVKGESAATGPIAFSVSRASALD